MRINLKDNGLLKISDKKIKKHLKFSALSLQDIYGRELIFRKVFDVFQFREFFVQEVFIDKPLPAELDFIKKTKNLSRSTVNQLESARRYWVNTPLSGIRQIDQ